MLRCQRRKLGATTRTHVNVSGPSSSNRLSKGSIDFRSSPDPYFLLCFGIAICSAVAFRDLLEAVGQFAIIRIRARFAVPFFDLECAEVGGFRIRVLACVEERRCSPA